MESILKSIIKKSDNRFSLWEEFINKFKCKNLAELGVYKGDFALSQLFGNDVISKYYMIDPWRELVEWNKPANTNDIVFEEFYNEAMQKTDFAKSKRIVLRGKTSEVINEIADKELDFVYIDGDHTLKGITVDLISVWGKVKKDGVIAGDDFCDSIWQHSNEFEPTLVFPFAIYFAEAMDVKIFALPYNQFLIKKNLTGFEFVNLSNKVYNKTNILSHLNLVVKNKKSTNGFLKRIFKS